MSPEVATRLEVGDLRIEQSGRTVREIVHGMRLELAPGEAVAIVGESGSGKSMSARAIVGLLPDGIAARGSIRFAGAELLGGSTAAVRDVRGSGVSLLMQDPFTMLSPVRRVFDHLVDGLRLHAEPIPDGQMRAEVIRRLNEVEIRDPTVADRFPFELSGGMRQRVALAASLARDPAVLIADEPTTALDVTTQKQILRLLGGLMEARGMSVVLITHDLRVAFAVCSRVYVMYGGSLVEAGPVEATEASPLHPYTAGLLKAEPPIEARRARLDLLQGESVAAYEVGDACAFSQRCEYVRPACLSQRPPLREIMPGRFSACIRVDEVSPRLADAALAEVIPDPTPSAADPVLSVRGLTKVFDRRGGGAGELTAVDDVSLEIGRGESVGLIGESGSGKSTIGRCLLGLETPTSGSIQIDGSEAGDYARLPKAARQDLRRSIQMVFQDPYSSLNPAMRIGSMIREALKLRGLEGSSASSEVDRLLSAVGLSPRFASLRPRSLSGGERQRAALARALAVEPEVLVCDECVSALDVAVQGQVLTLLRTLQAEFGMAYLFITHDLAVARQIADRLYVLQQGEIVEEGPVGDVLDNPRHPYTQKLIASVPRSSRAWLHPTDSTDERT